MSVLSGIQLERDLDQQVSYVIPNGERPTRCVPHQSHIQISRDSLEHDIDAC